jgi:predicted dehydrogenase
MQRIKCAIAGLGRIGSSLEDDALREKPASHAGAIDAHPGCVLISGCDIDREKRDAFSRRWHCQDLFPTLDEMLAFAVPEILCIATPPGTHKELVIKAVKAGVPLVICEKPLTESLTEAEEILGETGSSSTILMVNHERRYSGDYVHCREMIDTKKYGELLSITCKLYMGRDRSVEEMLWEDGTHMIDIIRFLSNNNVTDIHVTGNLFTPGENAVITLTLGGMYAVIEAGCGRDHLVFELDLSFTGGRIRIGNGLYEEYESAPSPYYEHFRSLVKKETAGFAHTYYFSNMFADAVRIIKARTGEGPYQPVVPVSSGMDGYYVVHIISDIIKKSKKS